MKSFVQFGLALCIAVGSLGAQEVDTKTVELRHLTPKEAVKLLSPYVKAKDGGVFDVGDNISIITMRDTPENIARMERVLAKYDHTPATIRVVFQLIEADTGPRFATVGNDGRVSIDLDSTLRSVLKFPSYRLLAQGVASVGEFAEIHQQLATRDSQWLYTLSASVGAIRISDAAMVEPQPTRATSGGPMPAATVTLASTVHLDVSLNRHGPPQPEAAGQVARTVNEEVIRTGLDVPIGHMVVLGTAATRSHGAALILTVKPELVPSGR
jgi:hypothetical protein